jgi:hypothetical protein
MTRRFKRPDYEATLQTSIQLSEALPVMAEKHIRSILGGNQS